MKSQLKQLFFLSVFCFLCTVFVFFVPWWTSTSDNNENDDIEESIDNAQVYDTYEQVQFTWVLRIAVKEWMKDKVVTDFANEFKEVHWWDVELIEVESPEVWKTLDWIDLYMIPYDLVSWIDFNTIKFQEDISSLFIPQLKDFVAEHKDMIPFGIDLPVMYWLSDLSEWMDWLVNSAESWKPSRSHWKFNFWISDNISTYDNSLISSYQIIDFLGVNNIWAFTQWIDFTVSSKELQQWLLSSIQWNSDVCKKHPLSCLLEKNLLGVAWWFRSDYDNWFEWKLFEKGYPYEGKTPFVRLYSFAVAEDAKNYPMAAQFILDYMDNAFSEWWESISYSLWLVPVFQNEYTSFCYQDACGLQSQINVLEDGFSKIDRFYKDSVLWNVISKKVQPNLYLSNTLL
jgi:hypothetical protein